MLSKNTCCVNNQSVCTNILQEDNEHNPYGFDKFRQSTYRRALEKEAEKQLMSTDTLQTPSLTDNVLSLNTKTENVTLKSVTERQNILSAHFANEMPNLTNIQQQQVTELICKYHDRFYMKGDPLSQMKTTPYKIHLKEDTPIKMQCRPIPYSKQKATVEALVDMLKKGVIVPSSSAWASPIVPTWKPTGAIRICVDYRSLNKVTTPEIYPLPRCYDLIDEMGALKPKYFTKMDMVNGFWQIPCHKDTQPITAFICPQGLFEFTRCPFGHINSPTTFQKVMQSILHNLDAKNRIKFYIDDVLICSETFEEHLDLVERVLQRFREANVVVEMKKCDFFGTNTTYLGHIMSQDGVRKQQTKYAVIKNYPPPARVVELQRFLGLVNYHRRFIRNFATIAKPLYALLRKQNSFDWTTKCQEAFEKLKQVYLTDDILSYPDFAKPFIIESDASTAGLGGVLGQYDERNILKPIAFVSRSLTPAEKNYCPTELEMLAAVWCLNQFRVYVLGHQVTVLTDHSALVHIIKKPCTNARIHRWSLLLAEYNPTFAYKKGKLNVIADALSRIPDCLKYTEIVQTYKSDGQKVFKLKDDPEEMIEDRLSPTVNTLQLHTNTQHTEWCNVGMQETMQITPTEFIDTDVVQEICATEENELASDLYLPPNSNLEQLWQAVANAQKEDHVTSEIHRYIREPNADIPLTRLGLWVQSNKHRLIYDAQTDAIFFKHDNNRKLLIVPQQHKHLIMADAHDMNAHPAKERMQNKILMHFWWSGMSGDIKKYTSACKICAARQGQGLKRKPQMTAHEIVPKPFYKIAADILKIAPSRTGSKYVLVVIDTYTKYPEVYVIQNQTAHTIERCFADFFARWWKPYILVTDNGPQFKAIQMQKLCQRYAVKHIRTSTYHPQSDPAEIFHRWLLSAIAKLPNVKDWDHHLPDILLAYRTTPHTATGIAPMLLARHEDPPPIPSNLFSRAVAESVVLLQNTQPATQAVYDTAKQTAQHNLEKAKQARKAYYDKHKGPDPQIEVGMRVWRFAPGIKKGSNYKVSKPFLGPFRVVQITQNGVARLRRVDQPLVHVDSCPLAKLTKCSDEIPDGTFWDGRSWKSFKPNDISVPTKIAINDEWKYIQTRTQAKQTETGATQQPNNSEQTQSGSPSKKASIRQ